MKTSFFPYLSGLFILTILISTKADALEPIRLSNDGKSFVTASSHRPFRVWGVNYDHDSEGASGRLLEDYWETEWQTVESDFHEMRDLGVNVVRIHLQFGRFMQTANTPNQKSLAQLRRLLTLAESLGLYLDITGLGCYHKADTPAWYDDLDEAGRWAAQAQFWKAVAGVCRDSPAVFCYDLMNEPIIGGTKEDGWLAGELGGKHFVQRLTLEPGSRSQIEIARAWVAQLTSAIRSVDPSHLITVGVIPWSQIWPGAKPIFYAPEVQGLDFVSIHLYPKKAEVDRAIETIATYEIGKPIVIEETFPLSCTLEEMDEFITRAEQRVAGFISFYWGKTVADYEKSAEEPVKSTVVGAWLLNFQKRAPTMK